MSVAEVNAKYQIPDELWERLQPLLPPEKPKPKGGRPCMGDRKALNAMFCVLCTGCQWGSVVDLLVRLCNRLSYLKSNAINHKSTTPPSIPLKESISNTF